MRNLVHKLKSLTCVVDQYCHWSVYLKLILNCRSAVNALIFQNLLLILLYSSVTRIVNVSTMIPKMMINKSPKQQRLYLCIYSNRKLFGNRHGISTDSIWLEDRYIVLCTLWIWYLSQSTAHVWTVEPEAAQESCSRGNTFSNMCHHDQKDAENAGFHPM